MKFKNNAHNYNTRIYNIIMIVCVACGIWPKDFDGYNIIFLLKWNNSLNIVYVSNCYYYYYILYTYVFLSLKRYYR